MSQQHKDHWLDSTIYQLALQHATNYQSYPLHSLGLNVPVAKSLTPDFGDHIFSCCDAHTTNLNNVSQDTLTKLHQILVPLAGFTNSPDSINIKTPQLAPSDLQKDQLAL
jgi:hypothetical protein